MGSRKNDSGISRREALKFGAGTAALAAASGMLGKSAFAADELKIGWIQPITGALASSWRPLYLAGEMAFDEINAAGGILGRKLVKITADDQGSPAQEPIVTRRLIEDGCKFIVGPTGSSQTLASLEVSGPAKVIQSAYATSSEMGDGSRYPFHYQFNFTGEAQAVRYAEYLSMKGFKKIGILIEDSAAGANMRSAIEREMPAHGLTIVSDQTFPIKTNDMTPFLRKMRSDGAEAVAALVSNNSDITQMLMALARMSWKPLIVGHTGLLFAGTPGAVPDAARYNEIYAASFRVLTYTDKDLPSERIKGFVKKIANSGVPDGLLGPAATSPYYDFLYALKFAIEKAKSFDTEAVKKVLDASSNIPGLFGNMAFSPTRHTGYDASVVNLAIVNSMEEPLSKEYKGLFRRRAPGIA